MKQLPPETVRLLSSSQVITSVLNVVKELMENSIDAGATSIDIKLENYGLDRIEVRDNGHGIKAADTSVMAVRHFTSKICSHEDLEQLETYGFRGEALGSICAVAEVSVITKTEEDDISTQYMLDLTGNIVSQKPSHLGQGTTVSVLKLFKNLPVRRQYYTSTKKCKEELKKVQDLLIAYAVIKPALRFTLTHNKVVVWQKAKAADHRSALLATLGPSAVANLLPCHHHQEQPEILLDGFFPKPGADYCSTSSTSHDKTLIFVNDRPVHQKDIIKLLRQHYTAQYPADSTRNRPNCNLSLFDDEMALSCPETTGMNLASESPEKPMDNAVLGADAGQGQLSAEDWSRGTALTDPLSGDPLQPVRIHQPSRHNTSDSAEVKGLSSPNRKMLNAITEKRAALTAYDLISNRAMRAPLSPAALFEREARAEVLREKPTASLQDISAAVHERWKNLGEEERKKYVEKAKKHLQQHDQRTKLASAEGVREPERQPSVGTPKSQLQGQKRKAPLSNQQLLDQLFTAQPQKKTRSPAPKPSQPLPCSVAALRLQLHRLSSQSSSAPLGLRLVNRLASQGAWVVLCGRKLMLLNPFRVEEALLFKRLLENNILPAVSLQSPVQLTDGVLGGAEYTQALCNMEKQSPDLNGGSFFSDARLVANGFQIRFTPGLQSAERHLEVTAMADCVPFLGVEDLREILKAVVHRKAKTVQECRPLKVTNYLQGEAVRLARQLPTNLTREDVEEILLRMQQQLGENNHTCIHKRPFLQHLRLTISKPCY
uniref:PMS1 homolog 1, mismatch repair system component n=1 Tax=Myripristis murdjan TaxID=586833 RepID=A0A668ANI9_9TELE